MENKIYIIGCGGHARSVADVLLNNDPSVQLIFVDENAKTGETLFDFPVIRSLPCTVKNMFVAIGDNQKRQIISNEKNLISIISQTATISASAIIEKGCFIGSGAHIGPFARIGTGTIINTNAVVEHEVQIGSFCHLSSHSTVCGRTKIGNNVFLGAGATVIDKIDICSNVIIGAGGTVVKNISMAGTYVGTPVHLKKDRRT